MKPIDAKLLLETAEELRQLIAEEVMLVAQLEEHHAAVAAIQADYGAVVQRKGQVHVRLMSLLHPRQET